MFCSPAYSYLLAITGCSWVLLFLSLSFNKNFNTNRPPTVQYTDEYFISDNSRVQSTSSAEPDPCDLCWRPSVIQDLVTQDDSQMEFYYFHTLNTAITSIKNRLAFAKKFADMKGEKCNLEMHIKNIQNYLLNKLNPEEKNLMLNDNLPVYRPSVEMSTGFDGELNYLSKESKKTVQEVSSKRQLKQNSKKSSHRLSIVVDGRGINVEEIIIKLGITYPHINIHLAVTDIVANNNIHPRPHFVYHSISDNETRGRVYNKLISTVSTRYVLVLSDPFDRILETNLKYLLQKISILGVLAVGGEMEFSRNPSKIRLDCLHSYYQNYFAKWTFKSLNVENDCAICSALEGSFVAVTGMLRDLAWNENLPPGAASLDIFLRAAHHKNIFSASCHKVKISTNLNSITKSDLMALGLTHELHHIMFPNLELVTISCKELTNTCSRKGESLPPCWREELSQAIRFILSTCEAHGLFCELQEGSLLGAVKMKSILPWERDGDITFHSSNFTALGELSPIFNAQGYTLRLIDNRWCCVDGLVAGGQGIVTTLHWQIELWGQHEMDSVHLVENRMEPTKILLDGAWVRAPQNPGKYVRNRYGYEIYRHAQHWIDTGQKSSWETYDTNQFISCKRTGHHSCLDLQPTDGVVQFRSRIMG